MSDPCHICGGDHTDPRDNEIRALREQLEAKTAELATLKDLNEVRLAGIEQGAILLTDPTGLAGYVAESFLGMLDGAKAENYVELTFLHRKDGRKVIVMVKRETGKTPHELRKEAEAECASLREQLQRSAEALKQASTIPGLDPRRKAREQWAREDGEIDPGGRERS